MAQEIAFAARQVFARANKADVTAFNDSGGDARLLLRAFEPKRQQLRRLVADNTGKLVLMRAGTLDYPKPQVPRHKLAGAKLLAETAAALAATHQPQRPQTHSQSTLQVFGHDVSMPRRSVPGVWREHGKSVNDRAVILHRAPSIIAAEISSMPHKGNYGQQDNGYAAVGNHAVRVLHALGTGGDMPIRWQVERSERNVTYSTRAVAAGARIVPLLIRSEAFGIAKEHDAMFGFEGDDRRFYAKREFSLIGETVFVADHDLFALLVDDASQRVELFGDAGELADGFFQVPDPALLAPALTIFTVNQSIDCPQTPPIATIS